MRKQSGCIPTRLRLTEELRQSLKRPLGELIQGSFGECMERLRSIVVSEKPPKLILVGDVVSWNATTAGIRGDVLIIDNKVMRQPSNYPVRLSANVFKVANSPGTIHREAWRVVEKALQEEAIIIVEGEEDLLALPAISLAPLGSIVVYGQPNEGIVVVRVSEEAKKRVSSIISSMILEEQKGAD